MDAATTPVLYSEYSFDEEIAQFFDKTTATRGECDMKAKQLTGSENVKPVEVQGVCSYTVYSGPELQSVVQFRLRSLDIKPEVIELARVIHGDKVPNISCRGQIGNSETNDREPLIIYLMDRIKGITQLNFVLRNNNGDDSEHNRNCRKNYMTDVARFLAASWNAPQNVSPELRDDLRRKYVHELHILLDALPTRFHSSIKRCLDSLDDILSLPMVLMHQDFGFSNIFVEEQSCHLVGVIDWAEAEICPFGQNLDMLQSITCKFHLKDGWQPFSDHHDLQDCFWRTFQDETKVHDPVTLQTIRIARIMDSLFSWGFESRLANAGALKPIGDDETGRYNKLYLDGLLINKSTSFGD